MKAPIRTYTILAIILNSCSISREFTAHDEYPSAATYYHPKGWLEEVFYNSSTGGPATRRALVYLPEGYDSSSTSYPTLYLLHGANGNETSWITKGLILREIDRLVSRNEMVRSIIVFPNMNHYDDDGDADMSRLKKPFECFFEPDGSVESGFVTDLVDTIDSTYRTISTKEMRAIAGLSMGGMQAIQISASNPGTFGYIGMFSPFVTPFVKKSGYSGFYRHIKQRLKMQFSDPPQLYWIMIGRKDMFKPHMDSFSYFLQEKGYPHRYDVSKGGHEWYNWVEYCNRFMKEIFRGDQN